MLNKMKTQLFDILVSELGRSKVIEAMRSVRRELFVPDAMRERAYDNVALPIGEDQTISQPLMVALMVSALDIRPMDTVLEIGTGSGYQAAVLAELAKRVITIERISSLADTARFRLNELGYSNIYVHESTNVLGWPSEAPYDAIIVAAGAPKIPTELIKQLGSRGRMVVPVGDAENQQLIKIVKDSSGQVSISNLGGCRFVPLIGEGAWPED